MAAFFGFRQNFLKPSTSDIVMIFIERKHAFAIVTSQPKL